MFWFLLALLGCAWIAQSWFSFKQSQTFAKLFVALRRRGRVAMGRFKGGLVQGSIVLFVIDDEGTILEGHKLQGITVAARFKPFHLYDGLDLDGIDPEATKKFGRPAVKAVLNARDNYRVIAAGGHAPEPPTPLGRLLQRLPGPKPKRRPVSPVVPMATPRARIKISRTTSSSDTRRPTKGERIETAA